MVEEEKSWGPEFMLHTKISLLSYQIAIKIDYIRTNQFTNYIRLAMNPVVVVTGASKFDPVL